MPTSKNAKKRSEGTQEQPLVFVSHKHVDSGIAKAIGDFVRRSSAGSVRVYMSSSPEFQGPRLDTELNRELRHALVDASVFILVYTSPDAGWDWCMWEAGFAIGLMDPPTTRLIVFQFQPDGPDVFKDLVPVFASDLDSVEAFVSGFLTDKDFFPGLERPVSNLAPPDVRELAVDLFERLQKMAPLSVQRKTFRFSKGFAIEQVGEREMPISSSANVAAVPGVLSAFGIFGDSCSWAELRDAAKTQGDSRWLQELERAIEHGRKAKVPPVSFATFRGAADGKIYRPVLYRIESTGGADDTIHVALVEQLAPDLLGGPGDSEVIFMLMRMAVRWKWEVIHPFASELAEKKDSGGCLTRLRESIPLIEQEAAAMGFVLQDVVTEAFASRADQADIEETFAAWREAREELLTSINDGKLTGVKKQLKTLSALNDRFATTAAARYSEVLRDNEKSP